MKIKRLTIMVILSLIISIVSIVILTLSYIMDSNSISTDSVISSFALLTTVLIGWNIYSVIDIKNKIEENDKKIEIYNGKLKVLINNNTNSNLETKWYVDGSVNFIQALIFKKGNHCKSFELFCEAIISFTQYEFDNDANYIDACLDNLESLIKDDISCNINKSFIEECESENHYLEYVRANKNLKFDQKQKFVEIIDRIKKRNVG